MIYANCDFFIKKSGGKMNNSSVKTAIFMADGCEEVEALSTYDILYRAGIECIKVSVSDSLSWVLSRLIQKTEPPAMGGVNHIQSI